MISTQIIAHWCHSSLSSLPLLGCLLECVSWWPGWQRWGGRLRRGYEKCVMIPLQFIELFRFTFGKNGISQGSNLRSARSSYIEGMKFALSFALLCSFSNTILLISHSSLCIKWCNNKFSCTCIGAGICSTISACVSCCCCWTRNQCKYNKEESCREDGRAGWNERSIVRGRVPTKESWDSIRCVTCVWSALNWKAAKNATDICAGCL